LSLSSHPVTIYTVGHSTRSLADFVALIAAHGIRQLVDIRSIPRSRRHPHFSQDALSASLRDAGVVYRHAPALGGMRKPRSDSRNTAWKVVGFRGYADFMETTAFQGALDELVEASRTTSTAVMCAEAVWWQCHRQLVADALVARGVDVRHIMTPSTAPAHSLTDFAQIEDERVSYRRLI
jgi:uncharacterized protein (DUF488 family)